MSIKLLKDGLIARDRQGNEVPVFGSVSGRQTDIPVIQNVSTNFIKAFRTVGCIGDSHMAALVTCDGEQNRNSFKRSWITQLFKGTDAKLFNFAENGMNCVTWKEKHLTQLQNEEACEAYFIALGTNDNAGYTPDEFYANYISVVNGITAHAPNCVIFCCSIYSNGNYCAEHNAVIARVSNEHDNCFHIDFSEETAQLRTDGFNASGHFDGLGHILIADVVRQKLENVVANNIDYFRHFISKNTAVNEFV